jgi:hypothetical protein
MARKQAGENAESDAEDREQKEVRLVKSIDFTPEQLDALTTCAFIEGHSVGPWIRAAALEKAAKMGVWKPLELIEQKKGA